MRFEREEKMLKLCHSIIMRNSPIDQYPTYRQYKAFKYASKVYERVLAKEMMLEAEEAKKASAKPLSDFDFGKWWDAELAEMNMQKA